MPKTESALVVTKIPMKNVIIDKPQSFPSQPILYLELIENKNRIDQKLVGKTYKPPEDSSDVIDVPKQYEHPGLRKKQEILEKFRKDIPTPPQQRSFSPEIEISEDRPTIRPPSERSLSVRSDDSGKITNLSVRLKSMLDNKPTERPAASPPLRSSSRSPVQVKYEEYQRSRERKPPAPTLDQLQEEGTYHPSTTLPHARVDNDEDLKRELIFKFEMLKKGSDHKNNIPEFTIHSDLNNMQKTYDMTVRRLHIDESAETYKTYLIFGFMVVEFVLGKWLKLDMEGFTKQQILGMNRYQKHLIELGEKTYIPEGSNWPVEIRLLFLILIQAAIFLFGKMIMKKTGANLLGMMNRTMNKPDSSTPDIPRKRMRSPSINLDDLPEL